MRLHPRIWKATKWGGAAATVLLVPVWAASGWFIAWADDGRNDEISIVHGRIELEISHDRSAQGIQPREWGIARNHPSAPLPLWNWKFQSGPNILRSPPPFIYVSRTYIDIPLWSLAGGSLFLAFVGWGLDAIARRRARLTHCPNCNYNRAGLRGPSALCPECGAPPPPSRSEPPHTTPSPRTGESGKGQPSA